MPGLLSANPFSNGAILLSKMMGDIGEGVPVLLHQHEFKSIVKPGGTLNIEAGLVEE